ncbi:HEPN domain-containing protein [Streptomyces hyderabadensis]|uniref:Apea-like HEPN domain-containing protein n=1 Tax=Streptomyces hyderabadensis TaxID=598549 RepID=A0ABP9ISN1_9ACTN|nr:HEPN domain-containing protein [Streptomyces hyderabadensis]
MQKDASSNVENSDANELIPTLSGAYGIRFLHFVLALPDSWEEGDGLSTEQTDAAIALYSWLQAFQHMDAPNRWINLASFSTRRLMRADISNASALREICGGDLEIPQGDEGDEVHRILSGYARDAYPAFLIKRPDEEWAMGGFFYHPDDREEVEFYRGVLKDAQLKYLFPEYVDKNPDELDYSTLRNVDSLLYFESGQGGSYQLPLLASHLINSAYMRCAVAGDDSFDAYMATIAQNLADARGMAAGRTAKVPVILGFSNVSISDIDRIELPSGHLRRVSSLDACFLPTQPSIDALLVLDVPVKLAVKAKHPRNDEEHGDEVWNRAQSSFQNWRNSLQWKTDCHRLAFMLADSDSHRAGAIQVLQAVINPLQGSAFMSWSDGRVQTSATTVNIDAGRVDGIRGWVENVTALHPRSLRVAMRRILSAASSRTDPSDALVDAVLAWENMFSDSPETSLRVCGSLSLLLEPVDRGRRRALVKELTDIYSTRSAIVHGNAREPSAEVIFADGDRALAVAVKAMRKLYENPDLLRSQNASARGKEVLLGLVDIR